MIDRLLDLGLAVLLTAGFYLFVLDPSLGDLTIRAALALLSR